MRYLILITALLSQPVNAEMYYGLALGYHSENSDCPEVCFKDDILARVKIGYQITDNLSFEYVHISAPKIRENGYGLNAVFVEIRF